MKQWVVSMIGSREHYAPPRALYRRGLLLRFYTDLWIRRRPAFSGQTPGAVQRLLSRGHPDLPSSKVTSFDMSGLRDGALLEVFRRAGIKDLNEFHARRGSAFAARVAAKLRCMEQKGEKCSVFFGFQTAALETFRYAKTNRTMTVLGQMDAAEVHAEILAEEHRRSPDWGPPPPQFSGAARKRMEEERRLADVVFVNSQWTRQAMLRLGVRDEKILVGPPAYESTACAAPRPLRSRRLPLRVLYVGAVTPGKGIRYLIEAARALDVLRFEFTLAGTIGISAHAVRQAPSNMKFLGQVPYMGILRCYENADVFVLPTLSDGFAIAQLEAAAHGLPVISTRCCGEVVTDGKDGILVAAKDSEAIRTALRRLEENRDEVRAMSTEAMKTSEKFTLDRYADILETGVRFAATRAGST